MDSVLISFYYLFSIVFNIWDIYFDYSVINWMLSITKKFFFFQEGHKITVFPKLFLIEKVCFLDVGVIIYCSVAQPCMPCFPVLHHLLEFAQTHIHWVGDAIQPPYPLFSPSPPAFNISQHQGLIVYLMCV